MSVTGDIPRYLEEIRPDISAEDNILRLCFRKEGMLFSEFEHIFKERRVSSNPVRLIY